MNAALTKQKPNFATLVRAYADKDQETKEVQEKSCDFLQQLLLLIFQPQLAEDCSCSPFKKVTG